MKPTRKLKTKADRDYWAYVERISAEVAQWPAWKAGGPKGITVGEWLAQKDDGRTT